MGWERRTVSEHSSLHSPERQEENRTALQDKSPHICFALVGSGALDMFLFILFNYQANISNGSTKFVTMAVRVQKSRNKSNEIKREAIGWAPNVWDVILQGTTLKVP